MTVTTKDYEAAAAAHKRFKPLAKAALTKGQYERCITYCEAALAAFDAAHVSVDDWALYRRLAGDVRSRLQHGPLTRNIDLANNLSARIDAIERW